MGETLTVIRTLSTCRYALNPRQTQHRKKNTLVMVM